MPSSHEVKYDGYRLIVQRDGDRVRLFSRNGNDWSNRYPWIVEAARKLRQKRFVLDGEAVILALTASPISIPCTPARTTGRSSFARSTSSPKVVMICASSRFTCARAISNACWLAGQKAYSSTRSSAGRSAPIYSGPRATWVLRDWSLNTVTGLMRLDGRSIGSRSRTASTRPRSG